MRGHRTKGQLYIFFEALDFQTKVNNEICCHRKEQMIHCAFFFKFMFCKIMKSIGLKFNVHTQ